MTRLVFTLVLFLSPFMGIAQITGANEVRKGNTQYKMESYDKAEALYRKSLQKGSGSIEGMFNLADAMYKQKKYKESASIFKQIAETAQDPDIKSKAYHNLGNSMIQTKNLDAGIEAYKNSLRINPSDEESRYNLSMALKEKKEQEQQNKDQDKKDQNKDQKDQDKKEQDQQKQDQQKQDKDQNQEQKENQQNEQDQQQQEQQDQQPRPNQMSKEEAKRMLDALNRDEKEIQDKLKKKKMKVNQKQIEKDW